MGYPMTWKRFINRNGLADGDYGAAPERHRVNVNTRPADDQFETVGKVRRERLGEYEKAFMLLAGDLRRLEQDATDEKAICVYIAQRTGVDTGAVAAVLKEFMDW